MKTKISQIISKSLLFAFIVLLGSCNYLDVDQYFDDTLKFDSVFTQKRYFEAYLWGAADNCPTRVESSVMNMHRELLPVTIFSL